VRVLWFISDHIGKIITGIISAVVTGLILKKGGP
jgi:hypothetical protein